MTDDEMEAAVDRAFIRLFGRTYRPGERTKSDPATNGDSWGQLQHDFQTLFGDQWFDVAHDAECLEFEQHCLA